MLKWCLLSTCFFCFSVSYAQSDSVDIQAITDLVAAYADARKNQDPQMIESLFTEDADQLVSSGTWRRGRPALVEGMLSSSRSNPGQRTLEIEQIRLISSSVAIADARYSIRNSDTGTERNMWSSFIAQKEGDTWKLTAIRNMLPAGSN